MGHDQEPILTRIFQIGVKYVKVHNGHGDVLHYFMNDGTEVFVWAFKRPDRLQVVHADFRINEILHDGRSDECRAETERFYQIVGRDDRLFTTIHD